MNVASVKWCSDAMLPRKIIFSHETHFTPQAKLNNKINNSALLKNTYSLIHLISCARTTTPCTVDTRDGTV